MAARAEDSKYEIKETGCFQQEVGVRAYAQKGSKMTFEKVKTWFDMLR